MDRIEILGGNPLYGEIRIQGSKNSALPIIAATILHRGVCVLHNCPKIIDVRYMIQILKRIGCEAHWETDTLVIDASGLDSSDIPAEYAEKMRSSIMMLGSLLGRTKEASIPHPGGCVIGKRPIDLHISGLSRMGVDFRESRILEAKAQKIAGCPVELPFPSVGATENLILAAVLAEGETRIKGAAMEPEIFELCRFLKAMGADIQGEGSPEIEIRGVKELHDVEYTIIPDRIVAGTYLCAAAATKGQVCLLNPPEGQLNALLEILRQMGVACRQEKGTVVVDATEGTHGVALVETQPYPGFPTDMQSQLMAALSVADGKSTIREMIFEDRYKAVDGLVKMGAHIRVNGKEAVIEGVTGLTGTTVQAEELRGGAALVIAGLCAQGMTYIENRVFIDRGYEDICRDLKKLGGNIRGRVES